MITRDKVKGCIFYSVIAGLLISQMLSFEQISLAMGSIQEPAAIVVDADTGAPIEGAVAIGIWRKHSATKRAWWEGGTMVAVRVEEAVSDEQGRIYIDGFWDWHFSKGRYPRLTIYKPEYICWDQKNIHIPGHKDEQRTDFDKKHRIASLKKWPENFSFIRHRHFIVSVTGRDAHEAPQQIFLYVFRGYRCQS